MGYLFFARKMPLAVMLESYQTKYPASNPIIALKALSYFDDINHTLDKPTIWRKVTFSQLKKRIFKAIEEPKHRF